MRVHSVVMVQARADGGPLLAQPTVCMHVQTGNTGAATVHTHRTYSVQHSTLAIATRNAQQSAAARAHWQHTIDNTAREQRAGVQQRFPDAATHSMGEASAQATGCMQELGKKQR